MARLLQSISMEVISEEPSNWFLFEEEGRLYLEVLVDRGAVSFSVTSELTSGQASAFRQGGVSSLALVSGEMRHKALTREWRPLPLPAGWDERSVAAIHDWRRRLKSQPLPSNDSSPATS